MDVAAALLCDSATVREGLLHVLGGCITRLWRPALPAPLAMPMAPLQLALVIDLDPDDFGTPHEIEVLIFCQDQQIGRLMAGFQAERPPRLEPGEHQLAPVVMPIAGGATPRFGKHSLSVRLDNGAAERSVDFWVLHPEEQLLPPIG